MSAHAVYKSAKCGCFIEIYVSYDETENLVEVHDVYIVKACSDHQPCGCGVHETEEYYREELEDDCEDDPRRNGAIELLAQYAPAPEPSPTASVTPPSAPDASDGRKTGENGGVE